MTEPDLHPDDAALIERLARIATVVDPVPDDVVELGRAAFALHRADTLLLTLVSEELAAPLRDAGGTSRLHVFTHGTVSIDVEVTVRGDFAKLVGALVDTGGSAVGGPGGAGAGDVGARDTPVPDARVTVESVASSTTVDLEDGRFAVERVPLGLVRIVVHRGAEQTLSTGWFDVG